MLGIYWIYIYWISTGWISSGYLLAIYLLDIYPRHCSSLHQMLFKSSGDTRSALYNFHFCLRSPCWLRCVLLGWARRRCGHIWRYLSINQGCYITGAHLLLRPQPQPPARTLGTLLGIMAELEKSKYKPSIVGCKYLKEASASLLSLLIVSSRFAWSSPN